MLGLREFGDELAGILERDELAATGAEQWVRQTCATITPPKGLQVNTPAEALAAKSHQGI